LILDVSVPSHCALMKPAAERLEEAMSALQFKMPAVPVVHNVSVSEAADVDEIRRLLVQQLYSPVRWVETVREIVSRGVETVIEAGPGKVLAGLIKRTDKSLGIFPVYDPESLAKAMEAINA
jgi:[acyl-carrier-protein] S-malonyltransferase